MVRASAKALAAKALAAKALVAKALGGKALGALATCCALMGSGCPQPSAFSGFDAGPEPGNGGVLALAGADLAVLEGSRVQLAGEGTRALAGTARLSWSQTAGPPVLLTNPSSALPSFVAPLAPATLAFELRAEADGDTSVDRVTIAVSDAAGDVPAFLEVPGDAIAEPGSTHSFNAGVAGNPAGDVTVTASACRGGVVTVEGSAVTVVLPEQLPCGVIVDGVDEDGRGLAPVARVFWPSDTSLPEQTRLTAPLIVPPGGGASLSFAADPGTSAWVWSADGLSDVLGGPVEGDQVAFAVPRRRTRLAFAGERRSGNASGGVRVAFVDVTAGAVNVAPQADAGDDRIVQPSARFRIDTSGSTDLDGDALEVRVTQRIGDAADEDDATGVFVAPSTPGTLLFHVVVDDGVVESAPDSMRVVVSADAENLRPVVPIAPRRFVAPGQTFTVDGRIAEDPDSGLLSSVTIRQLAEDAVILLPEPVELVATLVAGAAGDVYHFEISAFDDQGLGGAAFHEVHVEEAGPYVDVVRGDDSTGNGTVEAPFFSLEGALPTAIDHALPELLLAEGEHAPTSANLPGGLSLRGGLRFDGLAYVDGGAETVVPLVGDGLGVAGGKLAALRLRLEEPDALLSLAGASSLAQCTVEKATGVGGGVIVVQAGANAVLEGSEVRSALGPGIDAGAVLVSPGGAMRLRGGSVTAGDGDHATAIFCDHGTLALEDGSVSGGGAALEAHAVDARRCSVDVSGATLAGGAGALVVGLSALDSVIEVDAASIIVGATSASDSATGMLLQGASGSALLAGVVRAATPAVVVTTATGARCADGALALAGAVVAAEGSAAAGIVMEGAALSAQDSSVMVTGGAGTGVVLTDAGDIRLERTLVSADRGVTGTANFVTLADSTLEATELGCSVPTSYVVVDGGAILVDGPATATALSARGATVQDATLAARGTTAEAVRLAGSNSLIERSVIEVDAANGLGVTHGASLLLSSSFLAARGVAALRSAGDATVRSTTVVSDADGVVVEAGGSLAVASSALFGVPGLRALGVPPWLSARAVAFDDVGTLLIAGGEDVTTLQRLIELGCDSCLMVPASLVDATGHLSAGANALVDAGDDTDSAPDDIDGEARPGGAAPDIGCDERP